MTQSIIVNLTTLVILGLTQIWVTRGFTRSLRQIHITDELSWDPILQSIDQVCSTISSAYDESCHEMIDQVFSNSIDARTNLFLEEFQRRYEDNFLVHYKWLDYTDGFTQTTTMETILEVRNLIDGRIYPRPYCNNINRIQENRCSYYQYMKDVGVVGLHLHSSNLVVNLENNLLSFAKIAEDFFNGEHYEHAEGMAVFLIKQLILPLSSTAHYEASKQAFEQALIKASVVISEIEKLRGCMDHSSTFSLQIIRSYHILANMNSRVVDQSELYLFKLRTILNIPSIPPSYEVATNFRREIVEDLTEYWNSLNSKPSPTLNISTLLETICATSFYMAHQGLNDKEVQVLVTRIFRYLSPDLNFVANHIAKPRISSSRTSLRIGFISNHFRDHSIGRIMIEVMSLMKVLDSEYGPALEREIFVYSITHKYVKEVNSDEDRIIDEPMDYISAQMNSIFNTKFFRFPMNVNYIRQEIAKDELDMLIFADIGMDFVSFLVSFSRLATIQAVFWGHPITTGQDTIDYYFSLDDEVAHGDSFYSEQMIRMNFINTIPLPIDEEVNVKTNNELLRHLELPLDARIVIVPGRQFKMHPMFLRALLSLLAHFQLIDKVEKNPKHFVIIFTESMPDYNRIIVEQIENMLLEILQGDSERIQSIMRHFRVIGYMHYFQIAMISRAALDTFPYGGCITAHDAFFSGVPLVTLPLEHIRGRYAASLYRQMNYTELVTSSVEEYLWKAVLLATDDNYYAEVRRSIQRGFHGSMRMNLRVSSEWLEFIYRAVHNSNVS